MSQTIDEKFYKRAYTDIKGNIHAHFYNNKHKQRLSSEKYFFSLYPDFNPAGYYELNPDVRRLTYEQRLAHYHHNGIKEKRRYNNGTHGDINIRNKSDAQGHKSDTHVHKSDGNKRSTIYDKKIGYKSIEFIKTNNYLDETLEKIISIINNKSSLLYLVISNFAGCPPFGGGECWMLNTMSFMASVGFKCIFMSFDTDLEFATLVDNKFHFLTLPKSLKTSHLCLLIKRLNPTVISHQGLNRMHYLKISNALDIPFVTGFCFWQNIYNVRKYGNINILKNIDENIRHSDYIDPTYDVVKKNAAAYYVCSKYVYDIVHKLHNDLPMIVNTITTDYIDANNSTRNHKYVTIINIYKMSWEKFNMILSECPNVPFYFINNQPSDIPFPSTFDRYLVKNKACKYVEGHVDINKIYAETRVLLILSEVDETFCRVAYEGMHLGLPIISTDAGNLPNLLDGYKNATIATNMDDLIIAINSYKEMKIKPSDATDKYMETPTTFHNVIYNAIYNYKKRRLANSIGIICPWTDQGLGIQCREYYTILTSLGYTVAIYAHMPYINTCGDHSNEWNGYNVYHSALTRDNLTEDDFLDFLQYHMVDKLIVVEYEGHNITELVRMANMLDIKTYCIPNIEILRNKEFNNLMLFDKVLTNNMSTHKILSEKLPNVYHLGFSFTNLFYRLLPKNYDENAINNNALIFFCCGGLNSFTRKNIDKILDAWGTLDADFITKFKAKLEVYIQYNQKDSTDINHIMKYASSSCAIHIGSKDYKTISGLYRDRIFIHMGDHEGLGLGFYEAMASGSPVLTIDTPPNNEVIKHGVTGWVIPCTYIDMTDNTDGIVNRATIMVKDIKTGIINIANNMPSKTNIINEYITNKRYYIDRLRMHF
jgi:glycosyltransferase involved in cell wall biosynthesis